MKITPINNLFTTKKTTSSPQISFQKNFTNGVDTFVRGSQLSDSAQKIIQETQILLQKNGINKIQFNKFMPALNENNYLIFLNLCTTMIGLNSISKMFDEKNIENYKSQAILKYTTEKNKEFVNHYTKLGGNDIGIVKDSDEILNKHFPKLNLEKYSMENVEDITSQLTNENARTFEYVINEMGLNDYELSDFLEDTKYYSDEEFKHIEKNINNKLANYILNEIRDPTHKLPKSLNTKDFQKKSPEFLAHFNYILKSKVKMFDFLRFPLKSEQNIDKTFRQMGSLLGNISHNASKAFDEYEARKQYTNFLNMQFNNIAGMLFYTDKETVLHIFDKGYAVAENFINQQKHLTPQNAECLNKIINHGKFKNINGENAPISARDKLYAYKLTTINHNILAKSVGEIDINKYLTPISSGNYHIDFNGIENELLTKILNKYGFSNEEISALSPNNLDWDNHYIHLLSNLDDIQEFHTMVRIASMGKFKEYIFSPDNKYGKANLKTKSIFEKLNLDYEYWQNGAEPNTFKVNGETYTISLWKRRPQEDLFIGSHTNSCTSLDGTQKKSISEYIMNTTFNVFTVKNSLGETVATSRTFLINDFHPTLLIDNIEVNNTFKKQLNTYSKKVDFIENIFSYIRKFTQALSTNPINIYFTTENNKLFNYDLSVYPQEMLKVFNIIGDLVEELTYCNAITESICSLSKNFIKVCDVNEPAK